MVHLLKSRLKELIDPEYRMHVRKEKEISRLRQWPRYTETTTDLLGKRIKIVDSISFLFSYHEIFNSQVYRFKADNPSPYIIDCGVNIGLSVIYFKNQYPSAHIIGFEPDKGLYQVSKQNFDVLNIHNVDLIEKAVWKKDSVINFYSEGADAGRIAGNGDNKKIVEVHTVSLRGFLDREVDFLKIDIEGAEVDVLDDCKDSLWNVKNLFVEYHSFYGSNQQNLVKIINILEDAGFKLYINAPGFSSPQPFIKVNVHLNMDMQLNIYAYRGAKK